MAGCSRLANSSAGGIVWRPIQTSCSGSAVGASWIGVVERAGPAVGGACQSRRGAGLMMSPDQLMLSSTPTSNASSAGSARTASATARAQPSRAAAPEPVALPDRVGDVPGRRQVREQRVVVGAREVAIRRPQVRVVQGVEEVAPLGQGMQDASVGRRDLPPATSILQRVQDTHVRCVTRRHHRTHRNPTRSPWQ